jgi:hypothetical protein
MKSPFWRWRKMPGEVLLDLVRARGGSVRKKSRSGREEMKRRKKKEDDVTCLPVRQIPAAQIASLYFYELMPYFYFNDFRDISGTFIQLLELYICLDWLQLFTRIIHGLVHWIISYVDYHYHI